MADCLKDFGPVYGFWCFSYERYNGVLGSFPTNKKSIASQLMRRFVYESESQSQQNLKDLSDIFQPLLPMLQSSNISSTHTDLTFQLLTNCYNLSQIHVPNMQKVSLLCPEDFVSLKTVYKFMYHNIDNFLFTRTIKIIKTIRLYNQQFGSLRDRRNKSSSFLLAIWAKEDGSISCDWNGVRRPGEVLYYMLNKVKIGSNYREHLFAVVAWFKEHHCRLLYGKPMEVWNHLECVPDGPATFLPIHRIAGRFVAGRGQVVMPTGNEERVTFVCPIPSFEYF